MNPRSDYRDVYLEELDEQLRSMEEEVLRLEREGYTDSGISRLFRAAHTIKGSSAAMEYIRMKDVSHGMEHLLEKLRNRELTASLALVNLLFRSVDLLKKLQAEIVSGDTERSEVTVLLAELARFGQPPQLEARKEGYGMLAGPHAEEAFLAACRQAEDQGPLYLIQVSLSPLCEMPLPRCMLVDRRLNELSAVLWAEPDHVVDWSVVPDMAMRFGWLVSGLAHPEEAQRALAGITDVENVQVSRVMTDGGLVLSTLPGAGEQTAGEAATRPNQSGERAKAQSIRVNVERLENLMNLVGELVIDQTRVQQVKTLFHRKFGADELVDQLGQLSDHLSRIIGELHEGVMKVRMLPIEQLFSRFPRMVRDLAVTVGKEIELVMEGKETELDRTLIEELGDPLIHILRNAVDHGIESPSRRKQAGKREAGTIRLAASHEDNQVVIRIEDDGAGMDLERLKQTAITKGLITEEEASRLMEKEALALIFRAGFSTAAQVSEVSGRGVGMDIVRDSIERMNGTIDIDTTLGQGTRMRIALPLTLAIITGLKIAVDGRIFLIPMNSVAEIIRLTPGDIRTIKGSPVTTVRERILPVLWLRDHFNYPPMTEIGRHLPVVILEHGGRRLALVVDQLLGNQDIVLKSLGSLIGKSPSTSGATILGDGRVALILEVRELFKQVASHVGGVATGNRQEIEA